MAIVRLVQRWNVCSGTHLAVACSVAAPLGARALGACVFPGGARHFASSASAVLQGPSPSRSGARRTAKELLDAVQAAMQSKRPAWKAGQLALQEALDAGQLGTASQAAGEIVQAAAGSAQTGALEHAVAALKALALKGVVLPPDLQRRLLSCVLACAAAAPATAQPSGDMLGSIALVVQGGPEPLPMAAVHDAVCDSAGGAIAAGRVLLAAAWQAQAAGCWVPAAAAAVITASCAAPSPTAVTWTDITAAVAVHALGAGPEPAADIMALLRSLHQGRPARLASMATEGVVGVESAPGRASGVPRAVRVLGQAAQPEGPAEAASPLRNVLVESQRVASAVWLPTATATAIAALASRGHLSFARRVFIATAPRVVASAWASRPRKQPWAAGHARDMLRWLQGQQRANALRRPLAHAPLPTAAFVHALLMGGRASEAEFVHFQQRGAAATASLACLLPAVAGQGDLGHLEYLLGDGARVGTRLPKDAPACVLAAMQALAPHRSAPSAAGPPRSSPASGRQHAAAVQAQAGGSTLLADLAGVDLPPPEPTHSVAVADMHVWRRPAPAPHLAHAHRMRRVYNRLLAAGCAPYPRFDIALLDACHGAVQAASTGATCDHLAAAWATALSACQSCQGHLHSQPWSMADAWLRLLKLHVRLPDTPSDDVDVRVLVCGHRLHLVGEALAWAGEVVGGLQASGRSWVQPRAAQRWAASLATAALDAVQGEVLPMLQDAEGCVTADTPALAWRRVQGGAHLAHAAVEQLLATGAPRAEGQCTQLMRVLADVQELAPVRGVCPPDTAQ